MKKLIPLMIIAFSLSVLGQTLQDKLVKFEKPKEYRLVYDKFKDRTSIFSPERNVMIGNKKLLGVTSYISIFFAGTEPKDEVTYFLDFRSYSTDWQYLRSHHAILMVDGERLDLGNGYRSGDVSRGWVNEYLSYEITAQQLQQFAKATKIEVQIASTEAALGPQMQEIIRNMATLIK